MMDNLSPGAQAVLDAFNGFHELANRRLKIAATINALADQTVPANGSRRNNEIRAELLAIAAELRGTTTTETL